MFETAIAGSLPKPAWLAETNKLWPRWQAEGEALAQAKRDATLLWIKTQEDAGLDVIGDGEQSRQHFVHGFLEQVEGIDFEHKVEMGIRNDRYKAMVPQVVGPLRLKGRVHEAEAKRLLEQFAGIDEGLAKQRFPLLPAYDQVLKCSHLFNILDARGAISVTERVAMIQRVRTVAVGVAEAWMAQNQPSEVAA